MKKILLCLIILSNLSIKASTYYVSFSDGNDANNGLSSTSAWKTLDKVKNFSFINGDNILFNSGETWRGTLTLKSSPDNIILGKYGTGNNPIIKGSVSITGWTVTADTRISSSIRSNVWEANLSSIAYDTTNGIQHLFVNGEIMTIARYPNVNSPTEKNWLNISGTSVTDGGFASLQLQSKGNTTNYWVGSKAVVRTFSWLMGSLDVTAYNSSTGYLTTTGIGTSQNPEWGFFMQNKIEELDFPGEWYFDALSNKIYLYPKAGENPNTKLIEGSTFSYGISITNSQDGTVVENFQVEHCTNLGINLNSSLNVIIRNNSVKNSYKGIYFWNCKDVLIQNNAFDYCFRESIGTAAGSTFDSGTPIIESNIITNNGMYIGYGSHTTSASTANQTVGLFGKGMIFRKNRVINSAWTGVYLKGDGYHTIENNFIQSSLLVLNDGGNISIGSGSNYNIIRGNILIDAIGNIDESNGCGSTTSTPCSKHSAYGMGIGCDSGSQGHTIENNIIANNTDMGIRFNQFKNSLCTGNTLYNNDPQLVVQGNSSQSSGNDFSGNILYSLSSDQINLELQSTTNHGTINNNYYCNPYSKVVIKRNGEMYPFLEWREDFSLFDASSQSIHPAFVEYNTTSPGIEIIPNNNFNTDISGWSKSGSGNISFDNGKLKAVYSGTGAFNLGPATFPITNGQWYSIRFKVIANGNGEIRIRITDTEPTTWVILKEKYFAIDATTNNYEMLFQAPYSTSNMKILLTTDELDASNFWIDDFYCAPVNATLNELQQDSKLFYNDTFTSQTYDLNGISYQDLNGSTVTGSITLAPFTSKILIKTSIITGKNELTDSIKKTNVYPNPSNGIFYIDLKEPQDAEVKIFSLDGQLMYKKKITNHTVLPIHLMNKGIFLINIKSDKINESSKIVIN